MRDHVRILGILNIILGCLGALAGGAVLVLFGGIAGIVSLSATSNEGAAAVPILAIVGIFLAVFLFVLSVPSIVGGWGLLRYQAWARILMIVISALSLFHIPIGTALGIYGFWVLLNPETERLFATGGAYPPPPAPRVGQPPYSHPAAYPPQSPPAV